MDCNERDLLLYLEGKASGEVRSHIEACEECLKAIGGLAAYKKVLPRYREGKRLIESLEEHVSTTEGQKAKPLPSAIEELLRSRKGAEEQKVSPFRRPGKEEKQPNAESTQVRLKAAAIPRDLTKPRKKKDPTEKGDKGKK